MSLCKRSDVYVALRLPTPDVARQAADGIAAAMRRMGLSPRTVDTFLPHHDKGGSCEKVLRRYLGAWCYAAGRVVIKVHFAPVGVPVEDVVLAVSRERLRGQIKRGEVLRKVLVAEDGRIDEIARKVFGSEEVQVVRTGRDGEVKAEGMLMWDEGTAPEVDVAKYPDLPLRGKLPEILEAIATHSVVGVTSGTGTGKSRLLPRAVLDWEESCGRAPLIAVAQPRRVGAVALSEILEKDLADDGRWLVGCRMEGHDRTGQENRIVVTTVGSLLREERKERYTHIMLDEAHLPSTDLELLMNVLSRGCAAKVVLMTATPSPGVVGYWRERRGDSDVAEVVLRDHTGPLHEVVEYTLDDIEVPAGVDREGVMAHVVRDVAQSAKRVLAFCPGMKWMRALEKEIPFPVAVMHSTLPLPDLTQHRVILATDIAEVSLSIPDVDVVVDSCLTREGAKGRLRTTLASLDSLTQRAGRTGRFAPGRVYRLLTREEIASLHPTTPSEIVRRPEEAAILTALTHFTGEDVTTAVLSALPGTSGCVDMARSPLVHEAYRTLCGRGALVAKASGGTVCYSLTPLGRLLHSLPLETPLAEFVVKGARCGVGVPCVQAAVMVSRYKQDLPYPLSLRLMNGSHSDVVALVNLYRLYLARHGKTTKPPAMPDGVSVELLAQATPTVDHTMAVLGVVPRARDLSPLTHREMLTVAVLWSMVHLHRAVAYRPPKRRMGLETRRLGSGLRPRHTVRTASGEYIEVQSDGVLWTHPEGVWHAMRKGHSGVAAAAGKLKAVWGGSPSVSLSPVLVSSEDLDGLPACWGAGMRDALDPLVLFPGDDGRRCVTLPCSVPGLFSTVCLLAGQLTDPRTDLPVPLSEGMATLQLHVKGSVTLAPHRLVQALGERWKAALVATWKAVGYGATDGGREPCPMQELLDVLLSHCSRQDGGLPGFAERGGVWTEDPGLLSMWPPCWLPPFPAEGTLKLLARLDLPFSFPAPAAAG
eukprot:Sspe_Gene.44283::Locus_21698_Transcript_1_1_Confidence_1.000_Length_3029::g.44283::m.44283/K18408/TDRD9; ATP-dependent RNA helicase TDRD9